MKIDKETCLSVEESKPMISGRKGSLKVTITPAQQKTLTHLPKRPPVDLAFTDLTYRVQEGRKSISQYSVLFKTSLDNVKGGLG
ncbi:unnamed protein product [Euphydryas editha]|uniref:Retrotransposon gag domain-containing protein n=1 Tax=Euphydryas editha TaxID=104508 RepID=A0AAU9V7H0_EUPED|nr:unnamed protein product [Euphydryas editha]